jgi:hypothetical protein
VSREHRIPVDDFVELRASLNGPGTMIALRPCLPATGRTAGRVLALPPAAVDALVSSLVELRREVGEGPQSGGPRR